MLELRHLENGDNLRLFRSPDKKFSGALIRFAGMLADGSAMGVSAARIPAPPLNRKREYPSHCIKAATFSLWRAPRQFAKGKITADDLEEITRRCTAVLAREGDK